MIESNYLRPHAANFVPLTPLSFLARTAEVYPNRLALIEDQRRFTWGEEHKRCIAMAAGLVSIGVMPGDVVSVLVPKTYLFEEIPKTSTGKIEKYKLRQLGAPA